MHGCVLLVVDVDGREADHGVGEVCEASRVRALEQAHDQRAHIAECAARHEEERADRVGVDSQRSVLDQLGNERVVRDHVEREEEVVPPHERRDPHGVEPADLAERDEEHEQRTQTERDGGLFHQRDPAAIGMLALVGAGCDERVGDGVNDVTDGLDQPDNRENPQHDPPLRDEIGDSRFFGRLIKIDEVVVEHGRKQTHGKLRQAQSYDQRRIYFFMSPQYLFVRLDVSQRADVIALRNGLGQLKACVKAAADAVVAAHGDVAQSGDLLVAAAGLLPGLDQRAVVEIEIERVVCIFDEIHLEPPSGRAGEQRLSQTLEALGAALFLQVGALRNAASRDSRRGKLLRIQTALFGLVHQQIQPECAVLQQLADLDDEFVLDSRLVDDLRHDFFLLLCFITICTRFCALAPSVSHFQLLVHGEHENRSFFDENRRKPSAQRISERPGVWFCGRGCARCVICSSPAARRIRYGSVVQRVTYNPPTV